VPVENTGGAGTRDSHWRESTFNNELMTGYLNNGSNPLSRITVASLADIGYQVDISRADAYSPPAGSLLGGGGRRGSTGGAALRLDELETDRNLPVRSATLVEVLSRMTVPTLRQTEVMSKTTSTTDEVFASTKAVKKSAPSMPSNSLRLLVSKVA
jgi:hypothetical protein